MTPTIGTTLPGGTAQTSAPAPSQSAAPTDFMMLLAQVVGQPAQQAITPMPVQAVFSAQAADGLEGEEGAASDVAQLLSLPLLPFGLGAGSSAGAEAAGQHKNGLSEVLRQGGLAARAVLDVKVMTDMIQAEQSGAAEMNADGEVFHLPLSAEGSQQQKIHAAGDPTSRPIHVPVGNAQWANELGARLTTMTEQGRHAASLRLSPEHLGPLEIRIAIRDDQASVWFGAAHADTRAAIEHALPRLREMFEAQGMSLADAGVFHEAPREQPQFSQSASSSGDGPSAEQPLASAVRLNVGLVDAYA